MPPVRYAPPKPSHRWGTPWRRPPRDRRQRPRGRAPARNHNGQAAALGLEHNLTEGVGLAGEQEGIGATASELSKLGWQSGLELARSIRQQEKYPVNIM